MSIADLWPASFSYCGDKKVLPEQSDTKVSSTGLDKRIIPRLGTERTVMRAVRTQAWRWPGVRSVCGPSGGETVFLNPERVAWRVEPAKSLGKKFAPSNFLPFKNMSLYSFRGGAKLGEQVEILLESHSRGPGRRCVYGEVRQGLTWGCPGCSRWARR